jgi:hypothetical protein
MAIFYKITHEEPDYDLLPQGGDAAGLLPILKRAMSKELDARYQTAREMAFDLRDYLRGHATTTSAARALDDLLDTSASGRTTRSSARPWWRATPASRRSVPRRRRPRRRRSWARRSSTARRPRRRRARHRRRGPSRARRPARRSPSPRPLRRAR